MAIRYDKKINREIAKIVRNFNNKVYRLERQNAVFVPSRVRVKNLKSQYQNRSALKRKLAELQRFSERGVESIVYTLGGTSISKWELATLKREQTRAKRLLTRRIRKLETTVPTVFGKKQLKTYAEMGNEELSNLRARRTALNKRAERLDEKALKQLEKLVTKTIQRLTTQDITFYNSYFEIIENAGYMANIDPQIISHIKENLRKLTPTEFIEFANIEKSIKSIIDYYLVQKMNAGVLSSVDQAQLELTITALDSIIEDLVNEYA